MNPEKGQSAVEYLTTYGWMLLAFGAASYFAFNTMTLECVDELRGLHGGDIEVKDFGFGADDRLRISLKNTNSYNLTITEFNFSSDNKANINNSNIKFGPGKLKSLDFGGFENSETCDEFEIRLTYDKGSITDQKAIGTIESSYRIE